MNAQNAFPFQLHWTSHDLADAVPLRLFEMFDFDGGTSAGCNADRIVRAGAPARGGWRQRAYLSSPQMPALFRVRG